MLLPSNWERVFCDMAGICLKKMAVVAIVDDSLRQKILTKLQVSGSLEKFSGYSDILKFSNLHDKLI